MPDLILIAITFTVLIGIYTIVAIDTFYCFIYNASYEVLLPAADDYTIYNTGNKEDIKKIIEKPKVETYKYSSNFRLNPPKAEFFGRAQGRDLFVSGELEEEFLDIYELRSWVRRKEVNEEIEASVSSVKP